MARNVLIALALVAIVGVVVAFRLGAKPAQVSVPGFEPPPARPVEELKKLPIGMAGCMASTCHGGPALKILTGNFDATNPDAVWPSSGSCWVADDPHNAAYSLLTKNPRRPVRVTAEQIMKLYAKDTPNKPATEEARCVACHTNPALARTELMTDPRALTLRNEGVGCEACHGSAGKWVTEHTTWKGERAQVYDDSGMTKLYDIGARAQNCLGCHVGAPADEARGLPVRDMNHDMIAAGHPRLNFDFAEYQRRLPKHWQEKDRVAGKLRTPNPVKDWYVGRVAHAEAACALLASRAERAEKGDPKTPWPEFAEGNCAACHHHLNVDDVKDTTWLHPNWRRSEAYPNDRPAGSEPWQMVWPVTHAPGIDKPTRRGSPLLPLLEVMEQPRPAKFGDAKRAANEMLGKLHQLRLTVVAKPDAEVEREALAFFPTGAPRLPEWDTATQLFFGYAAMDRRGKPTPELLAKYEQAVQVFRKQNRNQNQKPNWLEVEKAFNAIRPRK